MSYVVTYIGLILLRFSRIQGLYPLVLSALFLYSAFRFEVGCDWTGYLNQFELFGGATLEEALTHREPLWTAIIIAQTKLGLSYPWLNVIASAIFYFGIHAMARRQPDPLGFLVLLFPVLIINMPMSGIRQGAAVGLISLAFLAFIDRRLVRFVVLTLLASGVHSSASFFLLLTPLVTGEYSRTRLLLAGVLALPGAYAMMSGDAVTLAASRYIGTGVDAAGSAFRVGLLALTALAYFALLRRKWRETSPQDDKLVTIGALMMLCLIAIVTISTVIGDRLGYYLVLIQTMICARMPFLPLRANRRLFILAPYLGLLIMFVVWTGNSRHFQICYLPYQTWIMGVPEVTRYAY
jgi:hypothetical protein